MPGHVRVFNQVVTYIPFVVPAIQPFLNLGILHPFLDAFVILNLHPVKHRPLPIQQPHLTVQNTGTQVVLLQQVTDGIRHIVVRAPWNHTYTGHRYRVTVPVLRASIKELTHTLAPVHVNGILSGSRIHKTETAYLLYLTHGYLLI